MKKTKKLLALLLACLMIFTLAACGSGDDSSGDGSGGSGTSSGDSGGSSPGSDSGNNSSGGDSPEEVRTLNVIVAEDPGSVHPFAATGNEGGFFDIIRTYMDILFDDKGDGTYEWGLCTSIDTISDIQYTLHLREGVTFSNGNPFTADDVMFSLELCRNHPTFFLNVKAIDFEKTKKIDDHTIELWMTAYDASQFPGLSFMYIFDEESYDEEYLAKNSIGTGPYQLVEYVANSHAIVEVRDDYWGEEPEIKRIHFRVMDEESQRVNAVEVNEADYARIPIKDVEYVESLGTHTVAPVSTAQALTVYFNLNENNIIGASDTAREAIMYAIDRQAIINLGFSGQSTAPRWPLSEYNVDFEERMANMDDVYSTGYDPDKAKELAEEAGLVGQTLRITTNGTQLYITVAEIIQNNLSAIGINSDIVNYDQATYNSVVADDTLFELAIYNTSSPGYLAVDIFTNYPKFIPLGWTGPVQEQYFADAAAASAIANMADRSDALYALTELFLEVDPWFAIAENPSPRALSNSVDNVDFYLSGVALFKNWVWTD